MEPFEIVMTIINTLAVVAIPIVSVVVAHHLQNRAEKRKDKLNVFKTLIRYLRVLADGRRKETFHPSL